jgi:hypothetical protein
LTATSTTWPPFALTGGPKLPIRRVVVREVAAVVVLECDLDEEEALVTVVGFCALRGR